VPGDTPLLRASTIQALLERHEATGAALTVLTAHIDEPSGYGRIIYGRDNKVAKIVEERDASESERQIREINTSIMVVRRSLLGPGLRLVGRQNAQNEYYLTDLINVLYEGGHLTQSFVLEDASEAAGVNDRAQLASAERELRRRINDRWMRRGVTMWDPTTTYIDADVSLSPDVSLLPGTILKGSSQVGAGSQIGPNAFLTDCFVGERSVVGTIEASDVSIGSDARVDSYAVLEPGSAVPDGAHVRPLTTHS
jgi:bifunctional UDP-N-acetylglucosamine pyrophosphorylase/glucosamine-1-phosphate N-acetyltransferase